MRKLAFLPTALVILLASLGLDIATPERPTVADTPAVVEVAPKAAPAVAVAWVPTGACKKWWPLAHDVGWRADEWPTLNRIMYAESRCNPNAWNPEYWWGGHASGLMQIIWPTWRAECGYGDIFRPRFNLRCAKYIKRHYGWSMWATY